MADIAEIGVAFDTSDLEKGKAALEGLSGPSKSAESSASKLSATLSKLDAASDKLVSAANGLSSASSRLASILDKEAASANAAAAGLSSASASANAAAAGMGKADAAATALAYSVNTVSVGTISFTKAARSAGTAATGFSQNVADLDAHVTAYNATILRASQGTADFDSHVTAYRNNFAKAVQGTADFDSHVQQFRKNVKLTGSELLQFGRQGADVGVTLAMGMNPVMVIIQQLPQILDAASVAATRSGTTMKAVFVAVGRTIWTALAPLLPIIAAIGIAVAAWSAVFGLATRSIGKDIGKNIDHLKLSEKQIDRLKENNVELGVTAGDVFKGIGMTIKDGFFAVFGDGLKTIGKWWDEMLDKLSSGIYNFVKFTVGRVTGMVYALASLWKSLPEMMSDAFATGANAIIATAELMGNAILAALNPVQALMGNAPTIKLGRLQNNNAGALAKGFSGANEAMNNGIAAGEGFVDKAAERLAENTRKARDARLRKAAGKADKASGSKGKTDAEKFSDIATGAQGDIDALKAEREAIGLTEKAAAELEFKTKLLNQAREKGIKLTDDQKAKVNELAAAYGLEKQKLIDAQFAYETSKATGERVAALEAERKAIGLVGRELTYQTELTRLLTEAKAKNVTITDELNKKLQEQAGKIADAQALTDHDKFYANIIQQSKDYSDQLAIEAATLGMTAKEAAAYTAKQQMLNEAKKQGVELTSGEILLWQVWYDANAKTQESIQKTREKVAFLKDTSRGFFDDMRSGLEQGKGFWETFGNAVLNVLDKIIDKMADAAFDKLFDGAESWFSSSSSNSGTSSWADLFKNLPSVFNAKGNAFSGSGLMQFAKGDAFTNTIVRKPTMFQFANGAALGEMGEAGPEAIMPLMRGPDGSLGVQAHGGGSSEPQRVEVAIKAYPSEKLYTDIEAIAEDKAITVTKQGIAQYDAAMPARVNEIAQDDRVR